MAINRTKIDASPTDVFDVLLDAHCYEKWVVGARKIRAVDPSWPRPGAEFHHTVGAPGATVSDSTRILELDEPKRLVLLAKARPVGVAKVIMEATPAEGGTLVVMKEEAVEPGTPGIIRPFLDPLIHLRNIESLRRLRKLVENKA